MTAAAARSQAMLRGNRDMYHQHLAGSSIGCIEMVTLHQGLDCLTGQTKAMPTSPGSRRSQEALLGSSPKVPLPKKTRAMPQVVTMASPRPSISTFVWGSFSCAATFISCKLCMVTILRGRFVPELGMSQV